MAHRYPEQSWSKEVKQLRSSSFCCSVSISRADRGTPSAAAFCLAARALARAASSLERLT